jgi:NAD(P)-dependent dehydrogenase (short-subunit alcohol dehydrogenase family)
MQLNGKTAIILGASRGIGAAAARALVAEGARVVLAARSLDALETLAIELGGPAHAQVIQTDLTDAAQIAAAVALAVSAFGGLDIALNNAGISPPRTDFTAVTDVAFDATLNVNLRAVFIAMKHQITAMLASGGGSIVNTGSIASMVGMPHMAAYVASKHALAGLTKSVALEYATRNIRINLLAPGTVMTDMLKAGAAATPEGEARIKTLTPMGRIATAEEITGAIVWLCSPSASYVTGAVIPVDGGYTSW